MRQEATDRGKQESIADRWFMGPNELSKDYIHYARRREL